MKLGSHFFLSIIILVVLSIRYVNHLGIYIYTHTYFLNNLKIGHVVPMFLIKQVMLWLRDFDMIIK